MDLDLYLVIDLGTGGPKVGLVDASGTLIDHVVSHVETTFADDGQATQDANEWWTLVIRDAGRLLEEPGRAPRVRAIGVTGQYGSTVPVDENGRPVGPCLTWMDTRGGPWTRRAVGGPIQGYNPRAALAFIRRSGGAPSTAGADPVGQILYLEHEQPSVVAACRSGMPVATTVPGARPSWAATSGLSVPTHDPKGTRGASRVSLRPARSSSTGS